jgi:hypothetical protein
MLRECAEIAITTKVKNQRRHLSVHIQSNLIMQEAFVRIATYTLTTRREGETTLKRKIHH